MKNKTLIVLLCIIGSVTNSLRGMKELTESQYNNLSRLQSRNKRKIEKLTKSSCCPIFFYIPEIISSANNVQEMRAFAMTYKQYLQSPHLIDICDNTNIDKVTFTLALSNYGIKSLTSTVLSLLKKYEFCKHLPMNTPQLISPTLNKIDEFITLHEQNEAIALCLLNKKMKSAH